MHYHRNVLPIVIKAVKWHFTLMFRSASALVPGAWCPRNQSACV